MEAKMHILSTLEQSHLNTYNEIGVLNAGA